MNYLFYITFFEILPTNQVFSNIFWVLSGSLSHFYWCRRFDIRFIDGCLIFWLVVKWYSFAKIHLNSLFWWQIYFKHLTTMFTRYSQFWVFLNLLAATFFQWQYFCLVECVLLNDTSWLTLLPNYYLEYCMYYKILIHFLIKSKFQFFKYFRRNKNKLKHANQIRQ